MAARSRGSGDSTPGSTEPDTRPSSSASATPGGGRSSPSGSPGSPSLTTFVKSQKAHSADDCERWEQGDVAPTFSPRDGSAPSTVIAIEAVGRKMSGGPEVGLGVREGGPMFTLDRESHHAVAVFAQNQRDELRDLGDLAPALNGPGTHQQAMVYTSKSLPTDSRIAEEIAPTLQAAQSESRGGTAGPLIFSSEDSPARMSPSPASGPGSRGRGRASSTSSPESQESLFAPEDTFWSRTSRVFSVPMGDGTSVPSSGRWPTSGFTISPGEFSTPNSSEYPNVGGGCSSLRDVLEADVAPKYFLSQRAAAGILRRAQKRGKALPEHLEAALRAVGCEPPTSTDTEPTS